MQNVTADQVVNHVNDRVMVSTGITAAGASSAPAETYGTFLATHGIFVLSYAECIQVLGATYVVFLLVKTARDLWRGK